MIKTRLLRFRIVLVRYCMAGSMIGAPGRRFHSDRPSTLDSEESHESLGFPVKSCSVCIEFSCNSGRAGRIGAWRGKVVVIKIGVRARTIKSGAASNFTWLEHPSSLTARRNNRSKLFRQTSSIYDSHRHNQQNMSVSLKFFGAPSPQDSR